MWDTALDTEAHVLRVPANITCSLALMGVEGVELLGTLDVTVTGKLQFSVSIAFICNKLVLPRFSSHLD